MKTERINQYRAYVTWCLRGVSISLVAYGGYWCVNRILFGMFSGQPFVNVVFQVWENIGEASAIYRGLGCVLIGVPLGLFSERLSQWMITVPKDACPGCGYLRSMANSTSGALQSSRCPECGLEGFMPSAADSNRSESDVTA